MASENFKFLFLHLLSLLIVCSSVKDFKQRESKHGIFHSSRRELVIRTIQREFVDPAINTFPTTPVTTNPVTTPVFNPVTTPATTNPVTTNPPPVTLPPDTSIPTVVTIPSANPVIATPNPPTTNPINPPVPVTNPVTTPSTGIPGGNPPVTTNPSPVTTTPVMGPPATTTNPPAVPGQSWCVVRSGAAEATIQAALDYACGIGGADCASIQQGASCYNPMTLQNHASYAFNSYYQKNPLPTSCDFGGAAAITNVNPSSGSCIYATSSTLTSPTTASPITTNPPTTSSSSGATPTGSTSGTPPSVLNATYPGFGGITNPASSGTIPGFADGPQSATGSSISMSTGLQPFIGFIIVAASIITGRIILDI